MKRLTLCLLVMLASAVLVALTSAPAYAVDGVVLINQNTSISGLPGCGSSGFPIVICNSGSYRLAGNLTVPANLDGIYIIVDNVTLDLNGFSIEGAGTCTGNPVTSCTGVDNARGVLSTNDNIGVRNGSVRGFFVGVNLDGSGGLVDGVHTKSNEFGIFLIIGTVRLSSATGNLFGIQIDGGGIAEGNTATGNGTGIIATFGSATGNALLNNGTGFDLFNTTYGSNSLQNNGMTVANRGGATSQNNNNCNGSVC